MTNYTNYKKTSIKWIEYIPNQWCEVPLRDIFYDSKEINVDAKDIQMLSLVKDIGIIPYSERGNQGNKSSEKVEKYKIVEVGDFVINKMNAVLGSLGISKYYGLVSPVYFVLRNRADNSYSSRYYELVFQTRPVQKYLRTMSKGIMEIREAIDWAEFKNMQLPKPTFNEQISIVNLLDASDLKLQEFILKKRKYIEFLKLYKQSKINECVTKGINLDVELKDSKLEWLGLIPKHWEVIQLKRCLSSVTYGTSESSNQTGLFAVLGMGNIIDGKVIMKDTGFLNTIESELLLENGDLLYNRTNSQELVGKVGIFDGTLLDNVTFASYLVRLRPNELATSKYLNYLLNSANFINFARSFALKSINQSNLNPTKYVMQSIVLPPIEEQYKIVEQLDLLEDRISTMINVANKEIELIQQYRQSLIYELVTGKRKP